jgi:excisionase family DNA binding protein
MQLVPTLDQIAANPAAASNLPPDERDRLVRLCAAALAALSVRASHPTNGDDHSALLTARQVAAMFGVPETWPREQARLGRLPFVRIGRYVRFDPEAVRQHLNQPSK